MPGGNYAVASPAAYPRRSRRSDTVKKPDVRNRRPAGRPCPAKQQNTQRMVIPAKAGIQDGKWQNSKQNIWGDHIGRGSEGCSAPLADPHDCDKGFPAQAKGCSSATPFGFPAARGHPASWPGGNYAVASPAAYPRRSRRSAAKPGMSGRRGCRGATTLCHIAGCAKRGQRNARRRRKRLCRGFQGLGAFRPPRRGL